MSLRIKIVLAFSVCIVLAFLPLMLTLEMSVKPMAMHEAEAQTTQLIDARAGELGAWLGQRLSEIRIVREHPACQTLDFAQLRPYLTRLNEVLRTQFGNPAETLAIGGLDGKGFVNDEITIDVSNRPYFREMLASDAEYVIGKPVVSKSDNMPIFLICSPIYGADGQKIGFVNGSVNLEKLNQVARSIDVYGGFVWIMDRDGSVYTGESDEFRARGLDAAALNKVIGRASGASAGSLPLGQDGTAFFAQVPGADDWILVIQLENQRIYAEANKLMRLLTILSAALLAFGILVAVGISGSIVRPVRRLEAHMRDVAGGNLDSLYEPGGHDEISALGDSFNRMVSQLKGLMGKIYQAQAQKRKAELMVLQSQINPHFLYNTLDTIQWKALEHDAGDVADMIRQLSQLFRVSLSGGREYITVADEMTHVTSYLAIQAIRYGDRLKYSVEAEEDALNYYMPKLMLQPLVENAIYHGIKPKKQGGHIALTVKKAGAQLVAQVVDDGVGVSEEVLEALNSDLARFAKGNHYGLNNIRERLRLAFGDAGAGENAGASENAGAGGTLTFEAAAGGGLRVTLTLPLLNEGFERLEG
ncbi:MAG: sensor histidine kinase [Clostridia bacterium]